MFNILLTQICNGKCPYCFAAQYFKKESLVGREMSIDNYSKILDFIYKYNPKTRIKLLGGEPTLHSRFREILDMTIKKGFDNISIFSNGIFSPEAVLSLQKYSDKITIVWNINPPEVYNAQLNNHIINNIEKLKFLDSVIGFNIYKKQYNFYFIEEILSKIQTIKKIRIGIAHPIGDPKYSTRQNYITIDQYPGIGNIIYAFINKIKRKHSYIKEISLDCGYTPCMFSQSQLAVIKSYGLVTFLPPCNSIIDIDPSLNISPCFAIANINRLNSFRNFNDVKHIEYFYLSQAVFSNRYLPFPSKKCNGCTLKLHCHGGCFGERMLKAKIEIQKKSNFVLKKSNNIVFEPEIQLQLARLFIASYDYKKGGRILTQLKKRLNNMTVNKCADFVGYKYSDQSLTRELKELMKTIRFFTDLQYYKRMTNNNGKRNSWISLIQKYKNLYLTYPNDDTLHNYALAIYKKLLTGQVKKNFLVKIEMNQFVDIIWNGRHLIQDHFTLLVFAEILKVLKGKEAPNNFYREFYQLNRSVFNKMIALPIRKTNKHNE